MSSYFSTIKTIRFRTSVAILGSLLLSQPALADNDGMLEVWQLDDEQWEVLKKGEVLTYGVTIEDTAAGQGWIVYPYTIAEVQDLLFDAMSYPKWRASIAESKKSEWIDENNQVVRYLTRGLKDVDVTLKRTWSVDQFVCWQMLEGNVDGVDGAYNFYDLGQGQTLMEYHTAVDTGYWIPAFVQRSVTASKFPESMTEFIPELERRFGKRQLKAFQPIKQKTRPLCVRRCQTPKGAPIANPTIRAAKLAEAKEKAAQQATAPLSATAPTTDLGAK